METGTAILLAAFIGYALGYLNAHWLIWRKKRHEAEKKTEEEGKFVEFVRPISTCPICKMRLATHRVMTQALCDWGDLDEQYVCDDCALPDAEVWHKVLLTHPELRQEVATLTVAIVAERKRLHAERKRKPDEP